MIKEKNNQKRNIIQHILIGGIALGVSGLLLRMALTFFGILAIPVVMGGKLSERPANEFMAALVPVVNAVTPYLIGLGAASVFLYIFLFPDKEGRSVLAGWGILMTLYLIAKIFITWL